jgi:uncharacterized protein YbaA (DUF1428 family)
MSKSGEIETKQQIGSHLQIFFWRLPKQNHDAMVQFANEVNNLFAKHGMQPPEVFQLTNAKGSEDMGFTNIAKTISANQDEEEIWLELHSYRDRKQQDEVAAVMQNDENATQLLRQFVNLITPGSCIEGQFSSIGLSQVK